MSGETIKYLFHCTKYINTLRSYLSLKLENTAKGVLYALHAPQKYEMEKSTDAKHEPSCM